MDRSARETEKQVQCGVGQSNAELEQDRPPGQSYSLRAHQEI